MENNVKKEVDDAIAARGKEIGLGKVRLNQQEDIMPQQPLNPSYAYIGTKIVRAIRMTRNTFQKRSGQPANQLEDPIGYMVIDPDGHISWSPAATFEQAHRRVSLNEQGLIIKSKEE